MVNALARSTPSFNAPTSGTETATVSYRALSLRDRSNRVPANQTGLLRWDYGDPNFGTCKESVNGGNHFRYWVQNGTDENSGAYFLAASYEKSAKENHDIVVNGYNIARCVPSLSAHTYPPSL